jgi:hypothetical protein
MVRTMAAVRNERRVNGGVLSRLPHCDSWFLPEIDEAKMISPLLTRTRPFDSRETVNTDINNDGGLEDG